VATGAADVTAAVVGAAVAGADVELPATGNPPLAVCPRHCEVWQHDKMHMLLKATPRLQGRAVLSATHFEWTKDVVQWPCILWRLSINTWQYCPAAHVLPLVIHWALLLEGQLPGQYRLPGGLVPVRPSAARMSEVASPLAKDAAKLVMQIITSVFMLSRLYGNSSTRATGCLMEIVGGQGGTRFASSKR